MTKNDDMLRPPLVKTIGDVMSNIFRIPAVNALIDRGLLMSDPSVVTPELLVTMNPGDPLEQLMTYRMTPLGKAVLKAIGLKIFSSSALSGKSIRIDWQDGKPFDVKLIEPTALDENPLTE